MQNRNHLTLLIVLLVSLAFLPGCIKYKQVVTLMPDGSGKIDFSWGMRNEFVQMAEAHKQDVFAQLKPDNYEHQCKGIVAFTKPKQVKQDGFTYLTYTAYFTDINEVTVNINEEEVADDGATNKMDFGVPAKYTYKRDGDTATLTIMHGIALSVVSGPNEIPAPAEQDKAQMRLEMAGFDVSEQYIMPGTLADSPGVQIIDNKVVLQISLDDVIDSTGPIKALKDKEKITIKIKDITLGDEAVKAFKKELTAAVKAAEEKE